MTNQCNATLTTASMKRCPRADVPTACRYSMGDYCDGAHHVTLHTLECENHPDGEVQLFPKDRRHENAHVQWYDDTPGATPHEPPPVSDREIEAACARLRGLPEVKYVSASDIKGALEAAARVRLEHE